MAGAVIVMAIVVFADGLLIGVIGAVAVGVGREDRKYSLAEEAPDRRSRGTRRLLGLGRGHLNGPLSR